MCIRDRYIIGYAKGFQNDSYWKRLKFEFKRHNLTWMERSHFEFFNLTEGDEYFAGKFKSQLPRQAYFDTTVHAATSTYFLRNIQLIMNDSKCFKVKEDLLSGPLYFTLSL